jgi:hypothetical protein
MKWATNTYRVGSHSEAIEELPEAEALGDFVSFHRRRIEPWLSAVFQAEHLNLLLGSGFTTAIASAAGTTVTGMARVKFGETYGDQIAAHADSEAALMNRGAANIEDDFRAAITLMDGLEIIDAEASNGLRTAINGEMKTFLKSLLQSERDIKDKETPASASLLQSFLLSFASRAASRERLHIFTTNYDRLIEYGSDQAGLRIIDRFVGSLTPVFRASRIEVDLHYNPPGIRGEPRFMEGVVRLTKLHGSLDWTFDAKARRIYRNGVEFGAGADHPAFPASPVDSVMIYPNAAKDVETTQYPYAELFRDFAAATCRPNAVAVTYGYGFGDDHINRVLLDMLTIPSTHLVIITYAADERVQRFVDKTRAAQVSILAGPHFGSIDQLVTEYLPKPALDYITGRMTELLRHRTEPPVPPATTVAETEPVA